MKFALSALGGWLWALYAPVGPYAGACMFLTGVNCVSALLMRRRLGRRLVRAADLGRVVGMVSRVNVALFGASLVQDVVLEGSGLLEVNLLKLTAALICGWQLLSILEHEGTARTGGWARVLRKRIGGKMGV